MNALRLQEKLAELIDKYGYIADTIHELIREDNENYSSKTLNYFNEAFYYLKIAQIYVQRIDYLVGGDDGEEHFHKRLEAELEALQ